MGLTGLGAAFGAEATVADAEVGWFTSLHDEQAAYNAEIQALAKLNAVLLTRAKQPGAQVLAGRYSAQRKQVYDLFPLEKCR